MADVTYITSTPDANLCIQDYNGTCIILTTHIPVPGCGATHARVWRAGEQVTTPGVQQEPNIKLISEL